MKCEPIPNGRPGHLPSQASAEPSRLPPWWCGTDEDYARIHNARAEIYDRDRSMAKKARTTILASLLAAAAMYGLDALGAFPVASGSGGALAAAIFLLAGTGIWILDRRLAQQFRDAKLHAFLWSELVAAVRRGRVDLTAIEFRPPFESDIEGLLRRQLVIVWEFLASQENLTLHLPLLNQGVTLTRV